jgi:hypothetical protein
MEEEDIDMYSSPVENYLRIVHTVETLEIGIRITEDWMEEHKGHILKYREVFPNFEIVNPDIEDSEFRTKAKETETLLANLSHQVNTQGTFNVKLYLILNKHMKSMCEIIYGEEQLAEMIQELCM